MYSETENMIAASVQNIFSENVTPQLIEKFEAGIWPQALWQLVVDSGFPQALCGGPSDGNEVTWNDIYPVLSGLGRWSVPLPLAESMAAAWLLDMFGVPVPNEPITLGDSMPVGALRPFLQLIESNGEILLSGSLSAVPWARNCRWILVEARSPQGTVEYPVLVLADLHHPAIKITPGSNYAAEPRDSVRLENVPCTVCNGRSAPKIPQLPLLIGALVRSAMICGALDAVLEQTIMYVNDRVQFGKPLARNQILQQNIAVQATETEAARMATRIAFDALSRRPLANSFAFDVAVAKIKTAAAARRAAAVAHQVHGAIGFTREYSLQLSTRRLWSWRQEFGDEGFWADKVGRSALLQPPGQFWPSLCARSFAVDALLGGA